MRRLEGKKLPEDFDYNNIITNRTFCYTMGIIYRSPLCFFVKIVGVFKKIVYKSLPL